MVRAVFNINDVQHLFLSEVKVEVCVIRAQSNQSLEFIIISISFISTIGKGTITLRFYYRKDIFKAVQTMIIIGTTGIQTSATNTVFLGP